MHGHGGEAMRAGMVRFRGGIAVIRYGIGLHSKGTAPICFAAEERTTVRRGGAGAQHDHGIASTGQAGRRYSKGVVSLRIALAKALNG